MKYFVTAIGTDSGKTVVSAILCEALGADYWKPIQSGLPRDTDTVRALLSRNDTTFHPERFLLQLPASPHAAARAENVTIKLGDFTLPSTDRPLVIEGAGGVLVPLNERDLMIDLIIHLDAEVVLVSNHYLGSINHTLLTAEALRQRRIPVRGIVFNGMPNEDTERVILHQTGLPCLLRVAKEERIDKTAITKYATLLRNTLHGTSTEH